jgi:predicted glycoside hydrolase/deacetylase ChbG (UPF0249 family)
MNLSKKLIINADDYGACWEVNTAVKLLAKAGLLGGVSVLANGECWMQAVDFLRNRQDLSAGIHLNAVEGRPISASPDVKVLTGENGSFIGIKALFKRWMLHPFAVSRAVEIEWRAQIERLMRDQVWLTHADSHQHLHAFPPAYRCAVKLCQEYRIPALRRPREIVATPARRQSAVALRTSLAISQLSAPRSLLQHNDNFLGFRQVGNYGTRELLEDLRAIPNGVTEIALHPSIEDGVPYPKLRGNRELTALLDDSFPEQVKQMGIELITWRMIAE